MANIWRPEGDVWTIHYQGRTVVMPNAKGLHDLRALLAQPGKQIAVAELLNPFDLDLGPTEQSRADRRARRLVRSEPLPVDLVHRLEIREVGEEDGRFGHAVERRVG